MRDSSRTPRDATSHVPAVVVGGYRWEPGINCTSIQTVRELARKRTVLYIYTDALGGLGDRLRALGEPRTRGAPLRTVFSLRPRHAEGNLWLAPLEGVSTVLPLSFPGPLRRHNVRLFRNAIGDWLDKLGVDRCLLLCYWWFVPELIGSIPSIANIYDCTDEHADYPGSSWRRNTVRRIEGRLLDAVDCTFLVSPELVPAREGPRRRLTVLPSSFDSRTFAEAVEAGIPLREPLRSVDGPVIGHIGSLEGRVDAQLVEEIVRQRPDWTFAFIGHDAEAALPRIVGSPNVLMLGPVPYRDALRAISRFDVGIIPFVSRPFTRGNSFLKLMDYFAHGMPVVATPLPHPTAAAQNGQGLVRLAEGPEAWVAALAEALGESSTSPAREARRSYVRERDVARRVDRMLTEALRVRADG